jgi:putative endonuclease
MPKTTAPDRRPTDPRQQLGLAGEARVRRWFEQRGWVIEAHRYRMGRLELDLVIRRGSLVAFVEVKTRRGTGFGVGREAIGWRKRQAIGLAAEGWRLRHGRAGDTYRFDVVEVEVSRAGGGRLEHIEDAWRISR